MPSDDEDAFVGNLLTSRARVQGEKTKKMLSPVGVLEAPVSLESLYNDIDFNMVHPHARTNLTHAHKRVHTHVS